MSNKSIDLTDDLYQYMCDFSLRESELKKRLRNETAKLEEKSMQISPEQGQFMNLLVKIIGAKKAIEIGVFTGYSSLSVAEALPDDGKLFAFDVNEEWTSIAKKYWKEAGLENKIELTIAPAVESLRSMQKPENFESIDFVFIDANKDGYDSYFELCLPLLKHNGVMIFDNVLWDGKVADDKINDSNTLAIRALNNKLLNDDRIDLSMLPVADGITLIRKK